MKLSEKIRAFFSEWELAWDATPGYIKAVIYATLTAIIATYLNFGHIDWNYVLIAVASNLGLYQVPRTINRVRKS